MFNTLIVAVDLDAGSDRTVGVASSLARRGRVPLEVLSVVPSWLDSGAVERRRQASPRLIRERVTIAVGDDVAAAIVDHVGSRDGALLVMRTAAAGLVSGGRHSVTGEVLARLVQPVLLLGPAVPDAVSIDAMTLLAGVDGGDDTCPAVPVMESWRRTFGGNRPWVVDVIAAAGWPTGSIDDRLERKRVDAVVEALAARGIDAVAEVVHASDAASALLEVAERLDDPVFVVTADRWPGGPSHWYSTTRRLVQRSPWPVLVVPSDLAG